MPFFSFIFPLQAREQGTGGTTVTNVDTPIKKGLHVLLSAIKPFFSPGLLLGCQSSLCYSTKFKTAFWNKTDCLHFPTYFWSQTSLYTLIIIRMFRIMKKMTTQLTFMYSSCIGDQERAFIHSFHRRVMSAGCVPGRSRIEGTAVNKMEKKLHFCGIYIPVKSVTWMTSFIWINTLI